VSQRFLSPLRLLNSNTDPNAGEIGDVYYNPSLQAVRVYTGTGWISVGASIGLVDGEIIPLDSLKLKFDGQENRFMPMYQGTVAGITNPHRVEITVNGIPQPLDFPEYVWGTPFMPEGFTIDSDGYIVFSEVPPAGATFSGRIVAGSPTSTLNNTYPFKAADILLGAY
jgi:hypothetical protein